MKMKLIALAAVVAAGMASQAAFAEDGKITFNGKITAQTCKIDGNGTGGPNFTVTLPTVSTSTLNADGKWAGRTPYFLKLTDCTPASGKVHTYYEPGPTTNLTTGNLNLEAGGATNVQLQLMNGDFSIIKAGAADASQNSKEVNIATDGTAKLDYYVQYLAVGGAASAGAANSSVMYTLAYQ